MSFITNGGSYEWKITNNGTTYGATNLSGGKLTDGLYKQISIGNVIAKQLELTLWDATIDPTKAITLSIVATADNGTTTTIGKGTYYVDTLDKSPYSDYSNIVAYDAMLKAEVPYMRTGTWANTTDYALLTDIATNVLGVTIESNTASLISGSPITIDEVPSIGDNGTKCREILGVIAALRGGNFIINDANKIELVPLSGALSTPTPVTVGDEVVSFDVAPTETVTRVEIWANGTTSFRSPSGLTEAAWQALGGTILTASMPIMASQQLADDLYTAYNGFTYLPYTANGVYISPDTPLSTQLTIKSDTVMLSYRVIDIDVLSPCDLSAEGTQSKISYYPYISPAVRDVQTKTEENYAAITVLDGSIESEVQRATEAEGTLNSRITQSADGLQAQFTNFVTGQEQYIRYDANAHSLQLGESDSNFQAQLSNTELAFTGADGQKAAWISNTQLNIEEAVIRTDEQFIGSSGKWVQQVVNDHFQIKWVAN